jgi:phenylacetate-CoA ligase
LKVLDQIYLKSPHWVRTCGFNAYATGLHLAREGRQMRTKLQLLDELDRAGRSEVLRHQLEAARHILKWAQRHVEFYRRDPAYEGDLARCPTLTRETVKAAGPRLYSDTLKLYMGRTSGTTGSPLHLRYDREQRAWNRAAEKLVRLRAGLSIDDRVAVVWGREIVPRRRRRPPFWVRNLADRELWLSAFHLSAATAPAYFAAMRRFGPAALETYPTIAYTLALFARQNNIRMKFDKVLTTSETLYPFQRETVEEVFQAEVYDYYACAERVVFAIECGRHEGLHLVEGFGFAEPHATAAEPLEGFIATGLTNRGMPLIRYRVTDVTHLVEEPCGCGLTSRRLAPVQTKREDILLTPDGRFVSPSILTHPFKPLVGVIRSQIIQERLDRVVVRLQVGPEFETHQEQQLLSSLAARLGSGVEIVLRKEPEIAPEASGKFRWVISRVKGAHQVTEMGSA